MDCDYCHEEILPGERADNKGGDFHLECIFRAVGGSVGHISKQCSCYGGTAGDPEGMTVRQAAKAAFDLWIELHK